MSRRQIIWEEIKECGFTLVSIGVITANLYTFIMMIVYGIYQIWEPWKWLLYAEATIAFLYLIWGWERFYKDAKRAINRLWPRR